MRVQPKPTKIRTPAVTIMLVYEPPTSRQGPVPIARLDHPGLAIAVAQAVIAQAETHASELAAVDGYFGELAQAEAQRLRRVLSLLLPGLRSPGNSPLVTQ
jgi:hypothetical protein